MLFAPPVRFLAYLEHAPRRGERNQRLAQPLLVVDTSRQARKSVATEGGAQPMCYTNRNREEEARRLRMEEEDRRRRQEEREHAGEEKQQGKPLSEKVKEMVGAR